MISLLRKICAIKKCKRSLCAMWVRKKKMASAIVSKAQATWFLFFFFICSEWGENIGCLALWKHLSTLRASFFFPVYDGIAECDYLKMRLRHKDALRASITCDAHISEVLNVSHNYDLNLMYPKLLSSFNICFLNIFYVLAFLIFSTSLTSKNIPLAAN